MLDRALVVIPKEIHLLPLPPHSPELQPAERLWTLTAQPLANRTFSNLDELEEVLFLRCKRLSEQREVIQGLTNFPWWVQIAV